MVDLDELDRLHAALPELEPASWMSHAGENEVTVLCVTGEASVTFIAVEKEVGRAAGVWGRECDE